jgi:cobalt/nickel transport system permease protein
MREDSAKPVTLYRVLAFTAVIFVVCQPSAFSMHISEGILPAQWAALWFLAAVPFLAWGMWDVKKRAKRDPSYKAFLGLIGAAVFIISCMPIPVPVAGSCSHPCGTGLAAILIGPGPTIVIASVALALQALFMAHGGITTLGGNIMSMGVVGALAGYGAFRLLRGLRLPATAAAFAAGALADWATYAMTSFELAAALHGDGSLWTMFAAIGVAFVPTQLPLAIFEGFLSAGAYQFVRSRRPGLLQPIAVQPAD